MYSKNKGRYGKRGRPPKDWKPTCRPILQIKRGTFRIIFDEDINGDLRDIMNFPKSKIIVIFD